VNWYDQNGRLVTMVEKKGGGLTAPSIVHARKLGLLPDFDDVLAVYHGSHIAAERQMLSLDEAALHPFAGDDKAAWMRGILARVRVIIDDERIANNEILGDVATWCDKRKPSSVAGIEVCEWIESLNPQRVELDSRVHSWCSVRSDIILVGCDSGVVNELLDGCDTQYSEVICATIARGKQDAARLAAIFARTSIIDESIEPEDDLHVIINVLDGGVEVALISIEDRTHGSDIAAAVRTLWSIEHNYTPMETPE